MSQVVEKSGPAIFIPHALKANPYRVLRLSADATLSEIHKAAGSMRRATLLGLTGTTEADIPILGDISRTEADIRTAIARLENPAQRISDRLFWLHISAEDRASKAESNSEPINDVSWSHDKALLDLFAVFKNALDDAGVAVWVRTLKAWNNIVASDDYWATSLAVEEKGSFEPSVLPSEIEEARNDAIRLAAEPLVMAARDALTRDDMPSVRRILAGIGELKKTGHWAEIAQQDITSPALERFKNLCRTISEEHRSKVVREPEASKRNKILCDAALKRFRAEIEPALEKLINLVPPDHEAVQQSREETAACLSGIATAYTWADDFIVSEKLNEEALTLAQNTLGAIKIEDRLSQVRGSAHSQRVYGTPISSAPSLHTINGFGFAMYGDSDHDRPTQSYSTTYYFVALFIPIFPIARYRVIHDRKNGQYRFLGKIPLRKGDWWHLGIVVAAIAALILFGMLDSNGGSTYVAPPRPTGTASSSYTPPVPVTQNSPLSVLKQRIEAGRRRSAILKTKLDPVFKELASLSTQRATLKSELNALDRDQQDGIEIDLDDYNQKVNAFNDLNTNSQILYATDSSDIELYDYLISQDSILVEQYNSSLK